MKTGKTVKRIAVALLVVLTAIQFFHPTRNINTTVSADHIERLYPVADSVRAVLQVACYDCHSDNTRYPWYFNIQPVAWWMAHHIDEAKEELNFSEFGKYTLAQRAKKLRKAGKDIEEGDMPLNSYTWMHKDAILSEQQKKMMISWARQLSEQISAQGPK